MITSDIQYWSLTLKQYCAAVTCNLYTKESFGISECDNCWNNLILATELVDILDCYTVSSEVNGAPVASDICLTDADIMKVFQTASHIINRKGGCGC